MAKTDNQINTQELMRVLGEPDIEYREFLIIGQDSFVEDNLIQFWSQQKAKYSVQNSDIINRADIGYTYFYDIINGKKKPSRDKLIRLFIAMRFLLEDCQKALRIYCYSELYPKNKRDSVVIYAINHRLSVLQLNELLKENGEEELK